jgi:EpsI family protein
MRTRLWIVSLLMLMTAGYLTLAARAEPVPTREPLTNCPTAVDRWRSVSAPPFDAATLAVLGVDEYINRFYETAGGRRVNLYVGYYGSQRTGDTMHSPLNCLPGAGWTPVRFDRMSIGEPADAVRVNRYVIEKGLDRQVVLYWYQSHGRVVASEYLGKMYLVLDAIRLNRTDGALVRIMAPVVTSETDAEREAIAFARALVPVLRRYLPS